VAYIDVQDPIQTALLVLITSLVCLIGRILGSNRKLVRQYKELQEQISSLKNDMANLCSVAVKVDRQRNKIVLRLNNALEHMANLEQCQGSLNTYQAAIQEIKNGADTQNVINACGFSEGEAELLVKIYGDVKRSNNVPSIAEPRVGAAH